ncbi:hypothetical protein HYALB_00010892 [Hymenoscyphus albidus]|uniref:Glycoside hydrolase family 5 domain-containing protein n=1 Tax=Hymenoscyphus albidus TaxID=595503 RepID=A0A9N9LRI2_9HELO|nr:hypothetical protein HYALB_00010892 [Hymenoscyphus albidus]
MHFQSFLPLAFVGSVLVAAYGGPLVTNGRWIENDKGENVTFAGINWPGAGETMTPEGLQYKSIEAIVSDIKSLGMNAIRLTFATEMIDQHFDKGKDTPLLESFQAALGPDNGQAVFDKVLANNPTFTPETTRLQVFDAIAAEADKQQIWIVLDNHISKGMWCCKEYDGNSWWGDTHFNTDNWKRGLNFMATRGKDWKSLVGLGLRNELRKPTSVPAAEATYNWATWYKNMIPAANEVNVANPDLLILYSGLNYDTDLSAISTGQHLGEELYFKKADFTYANKMVLELHNYQTEAKECREITDGLYTNGFNALDENNAEVQNVMPVLLTEWGHDQTTEAYKGVYATCLATWLPQMKAGWMMWAIAGSYYIREGEQDRDETWALYNHDWSGWRQDAAAEKLRSHVAGSLA